MLRLPGFTHELHIPRGNSQTDFFLTSEFKATHIHTDLAKITQPTQSFIMAQL